MKMVRGVLVLVLLIGVVGLTFRLMPARAAQPSFDRLSAEDREALQKRFEKEIWPLMQRGDKDGCLGCHSGKLVSALRLTGKIDKDFPHMIKEGFFIPGDSGSILSRVTDKDAKRRMPPPGKAPAWSAAEIALLRSFVGDLDKKQKK